MSRYERARIDLREQARRRVRAATRWAALASGALAAAFTVLLAHQGAAAAPQPTSTPTVAPQGVSAPALAPPAQAPSVGLGNGYSAYGSSGGS
jgi:hypothetical protein